MTGPAGEQRGAQTLDRGLQLLEAVASASGPLSVGEAAAAVGVHRTVAHRLVTTLTARGYLRRADGGGYRLGSTCIVLASAAADLRAVLRPLLTDLVDRTDETVALAVLSGREVVYLDSIEGTRTLRVAHRVGRRFPAHATSVGKALLAELDTDRLRVLFPDDALPPVTAHTIVSRSRLEAALATVRRRGYATSVGENEDGAGSVAVVVRTPTGEAAAAVSVAMPLVRLTPATRHDITAALTATATAMGALLTRTGPGSRPPR